MAILHIHVYHFQSPGRSAYAKDYPKTSKDSLGHLVAVLDMMIIKDELSSTLRIQYVWKRERERVCVCVCGVQITGGGGADGG